MHDLKQQPLFGRGALGEPSFIRIDGQDVEISPVFETFWKFAAERQTMFYKKLAGQPSLTEDPILARYKFTNAYRASDRVSQYLIREVIYSDAYSPQDLLFRILLFKIFNSIETWERLESALGHISFTNYSFCLYDALLTGAMSQGSRIYSPAYIMPTSKTEPRKHRSHLRLLEAMMQSRLHETIARSRNMEEAFLALRAYPMIGNFLAYQFVTDLNYSTLCNFSETEFVMPGPGALDGFRKCFPRLPLQKAPMVIGWMAKHQDQLFRSFGLKFWSLWGRPLQYIDCQNLFCEVDKYSRIAHPEIIGISGRQRIKQQFRRSPEPLPLFYPPKWELNDKLQRLAMPLAAH